MRKQKGDKLTYTEVMAKFEARYGGGGSSVMRRKWQEVAFQTVGKHTSAQLREFQVNFLSCAQDVHDATPSEAHRLLLQKLPQFMTAWVVEREAKMDREKPSFEISLQGTYTENDIKASLRGITGSNRSKVAISGLGSYRVQFDRGEVADKMLACHGRVLSGNAGVFRVHRVENQMALLDIFEFLHNRLVEKEKVDIYQQGKDRPPRLYRDTRAVTERPTTPRRNGTNRGATGGMCL